MFVMLCSSPLNFGARVLLAQAAATAAAFGGAVLAGQTQIVSAETLYDKVSALAAAVEALEKKMAVSGSAPVGFGSFDMAGKCVIVTGGASGIGFGMCELFAQRGSKVYCLDLFPEAVKKAEETLGPNVRGPRL